MPSAPRSTFAPPLLPAVSMQHRPRPHLLAPIVLLACVLAPACADADSGPEDEDSHASASTLPTDTAGEDALGSDLSFPTPHTREPDPSAGPPPEVDATDPALPSDTAPAPDASEPTVDATIRYTGHIRYDDRAFDTGGFTGEIDVLPARDVVVQLVREQDGTVLASTLTDALGRYRIEAPAASDERRHIRAVAAGRVDDLTVVVRDRSSRPAAYAMRSPTIQGDAQPAGDIDLHAGVEDAIGGAMNITDVSTEGFRFIAPWLAEGEGAPLTYSWQPGRAFGCGSCYRANTVFLGGQVEDPDEYDDDIILHELGHWFVDNFSADSSPGGPHRDRLVDPLLAYGEGLAYFFVGLVRDTPHIVDNFLGARRWIDMENLLQNGVYQENMTGTADGTVTGAHREELVSGVLWHAYREPDGTHAFDDVHLGVEGHMRLLTEVFGRGTHADVGAPGIDLADWLVAAACHLDVPAADLQALADAHDYPFAVALALQRCDEVSGTDGHKEEAGPAPSTAHKAASHAAAGPDQPAPRTPASGEAAPRPTPPNEVFPSATSSPPPRGSCALKATGFRHLTLERDARGVHLTDTGGRFRSAPVAVRIETDAGTREHVVRCAALPCTLTGPAPEDALVVALAPQGLDHAAGSWLGSRAEERMLGEGKLVEDETFGVLRVYVSR